MITSNVLPNGYRIAELDDFRERGCLKLRVQYWVYSQVYEEYQRQTTNWATDAKLLKQLIEQKRVFVPSK